MSCSISDSIFHIVVSYFVSNCALFISQFVQTVVAVSKQSSGSGRGQYMWLGGGAGGFKASKYDLNFTKDLRSFACGNTHNG